MFILVNSKFTYLLTFLELHPISRTCWEGPCDLAWVQRAHCLHSCTSICQNLCLHIPHSHPWDSLDLLPLFPYPTLRAQESPWAKPPSPKTHHHALPGKQDADSFSLKHMNIWAFHVFPLLSSSFSPMESFPFCGSSKSIHALNALIQFSWECKGNWLKKKIKLNSYLSYCIQTLDRF